MHTTGLRTMISEYVFSPKRALNIDLKVGRIATIVLLLLLEACVFIPDMSERASISKTQKPNPIWVASLDVLDFLPVQAINSETGLIVTGYGIPPGGDTEYSATILIIDNAIDASSLKLAISTPDGPVAKHILEAVEESILIRARQLYSSRHESHNLQMHTSRLQLAD